MKIPFPCRKRLARRDCKHGLLVNQISGCGHETAGVLDAANPLERPAGAAVEPQALVDRRARALIEVGQARVGNAWLRIGSCAIVAVVATSLVGNWWPLYWLVGLVPVILTDRAVFERLARESAAGRAPKNLGRMMLWCVLQSLYGNSLAILLWFSPYVPSDSLTIIFLCGGLANAAASLRASTPLAIASVTPTICFMLGLPVAEFFLNGGRNTHDLTPLVGGMLLLGFGMNLWKSLLASDAAHARAEEAALREQQAAAAAAAAKTDTIRRLNDEMRTPLSALIGAAEHLRRVAATPNARAQVATLLQAGDVLKQVMADISDLDRLENGALHIEPAPAVVRDVVRSVVNSFRAAAHDKNLELFVDISADTPICVEMDALRVRQVLFNLLGNAVRYTTHGGVRMRVSAAPGYTAGHVQLSFVITDTGAGMSRAQLAAIFNRDRVGGDGDGPGLGLAISLRLARAMGGTISARSEPGEGSAFTFIVPAPIVLRRENAAA